VVCGLLGRHWSLGHQLSEPGNAQSSTEVLEEVEGLLGVVGVGDEHLSKYWARHPFGEAS
jgi:hypothetical protein